MQAGICAYCGRHIVHDMPRHISTYHKCCRDSSTGPGSSSSCPAPSPHGITHAGQRPSFRKAARAVASATSPDVADISPAPTSPLALGSACRVPAHSSPDRSATQDELSPAETSTGVSMAQYSGPPAPVVCPFPSDRRQPILPVSLPLPHFATQDSALDLVTAHSHLVSTQLYPSSPGSRSSTPCYDLAEFDSENPRTAMSGSPVSDVVSVVVVPA